MDIQTNKKTVQTKHVRSTALAAKLHSMGLAAEVSDSIADSIADVDARKAEKTVVSGISNSINDIRLLLGTA